MMSRVINDPLSSPLILMDEDGNIVKRYIFDPFGNLEAQWGTEPNHYLFTGKERDENGLYYFGARYYNPRLGRWITPEPLFNDPARLGDLKLEEPQSLNPYTYCVNNPFLYLDPTGEVYVKQAIFASLQIAGGAAGAVLSFGSIFISASTITPVAIPCGLFSLEQIGSGILKLIAAIKEQPEPPSRIERLGEIIGGEKGRMIAGIIEAIGGAISPNPGGKVKMTLSVLSEVKSLKSIKLYKKIAGALGLVNESIVNIRRIEGGYEILTDRGRKIFVFEEEYWGYPPELFYLHNVH